MKIDKFDKRPNYFGISTSKSYDDGTVFTIPILVKMDNQLKNKVMSAMRKTAENCLMEEGIKKLGGNHE